MTTSIILTDIQRKQRDFQQNCGQVAAFLWLIHALDDYLMAISQAVYMIQKVNLSAYSKSDTN